MNSVSVGKMKDFRKFVEVSTLMVGNKNFHAQFLIKGDDNDYCQILMI